MFSHLAIYSIIVILGYMYNIYLYIYNYNYNLIKFLYIQLTSLFSNITKQFRTHLAILVKSIKDSAIID